MSSRAGHGTTETVFGQMLALWLGDGDEHRPLESDMTGQIVKGNLYLYLYLTSYEIMPSLVGSEMCIRDRTNASSMGGKQR